MFTDGLKYAYPTIVTQLRAESINEGALKTQNPITYLSFLPWKQKLN